MRYRPRIAKSTRISSVQHHFNFWILWGFFTIRFGYGFADLETDLHLHLHIDWDYCKMHLTRHSDELKKNGQAIRLAKLEQSKKSVKTSK